MKKYFFSLLALTALLGWTAYAVNTPEINCGGLPGCKSGNKVSGGVFDIIGNVIALLIQYVAVFAVIMVMVGGIMFLISTGDEERVKRAKKIIIWSLVGVLLSVSAWLLIGFINRIVI